MCVWGVLRKFLIIFGDDKAPSHYGGVYMEPFTRGGENRVGLKVSRR